MSRARSSQQWTSGDAVHRSQPPASANAGPGRGLGTLEQYGEDRLIVMGPDRAGTWLELMAMPADEADRIIHSDRLPPKFYEFHRRSMNS